MEALSLPTRQTNLWDIWACLIIAQNKIMRALESEHPSPLERSHDPFVTTRWSVVLSCADAGGDEQKTRKALAELCKIYWRPVFAFICRQGYSVPDAQDLTQDFL